MTLLCVTWRRTTNPFIIRSFVHSSARSQSVLLINNLHYTVSISKNAPTLASCSFDQHWLTLIIFGQQHQHTSENDTQLYLFLHFYLLYLLLNSCNGNDAFWRHSMHVKKSSFFGGKHRILSLQICVAKQFGWLQNLWTDAGTCVHCTNTCQRYQPLWPVTWSSASMT